MIDDPDFPPAEDEEQTAGIVTLQQPATALTSSSRELQAQLDSERELARVKGILFLAHQHPRDEVLAIRHIVQDCARIEIAAKATYNFARGGTRVTGPSIRLMEVIARRWKNLDMGVAELDQGDGESLVEAWAWDLESNVSDRKRFRVPHTRDKKGGVKIRLTDSRDIYERIANDGARRKRACIEAVIPKHVVDEALREVDKTLKASQMFQVTKDNLEAMRLAFEQFGVTVSMLEARVQCRWEAMTPRLMVQLKGVLNALEDGMTTVPEQFDISVEGKVAVEFPDEIRELARKANWPDNLLHVQYERYNNFETLKKALENIVARQSQSSRTKARDTSTAPSYDTKPGSMTAETRGPLFAALGRRGIIEAADRHDWAKAHKIDIVGGKDRPERVESFRNLSEAEAQKALDILTVKVGEEWRDRVLLARCEACNKSQGEAHAKGCPIDEVS